MDLKTRIVDELTVVRSRSLDLLDPLDPDALVRQHSPLMSPLIWDLAHVGNYEDLWLLRAVGVDGVGPQYDDTYDAFRHARRDRPGLALLDHDATHRYLAEVRDRAVDRLDAVDLDGTEPLLRGGFVYGMVVQHEHQHDETMLATLNLMAARALLAHARIPAPTNLQQRGDTWRTSWRSFEVCATSADQILNLTRGHVERTTAALWRTTERLLDDMQQIEGARMLTVREAFSLMRAAQATYWQATQQVHHELVALVQAPLPQRAAEVDHGTH